MHRRQLLPVELCDCVARILLPFDEITASRVPSNVNFIGVSVYFVKNVTKLMSKLV